MVGREKVYITRSEPILSEAKMLNIFRYFRERKEEKLRLAKEEEDKKLAWIEELGRREKEASERFIVSAKKYSEEVEFALLIRNNWNKTPEFIKERARRLALKYVSLSPSCFLCNRTDNLERHHQDYSKPLEIVTLCRSCHSHLHAYNGHRRLHLDYIIALDRKLGHI